jgi:hypothetical protein
MSDIVSIRKAAETIADQAVRRTTGAAEHAALLAEKMHALVEAGLEAQKVLNGRELAIFERDFAKIGRLVDRLAEGNYADTAAHLAGISPASVRSWLASAEKGEPRYQLIADVIQLGAAVAESESLGHVRSAGRDPRNWAASMTFLERRYPGKWGRRPDDTEVPKVIVQIGIKDSDVSIHAAQTTSHVTEVLKDPDL